MNAHIQTIQLEIPGSKHQVNSFVCWLKELANESSANIPCEEVDMVNRYQDKLAEIADQINNQL